MWRLGPLLIATAMATAFGAFVGALVAWIAGLVGAAVFESEPSFLRWWLWAGLAAAFAVWLPWLIGILRHKPV